MSKYTLGKCKYCGKHKPLKDGVCVDCENKLDMPDFMRDIFGGFK